MKTALQKFFGYFLIGVLGLMPIVIIVQIVIYIEVLLGGFVMNISGRYENPLVPVALFAAAIALLTYVGYLVKQDKAYLLYFVEKLINRLPLLGTIYRVSKKIFSLFRGDDENRLREVVYIEYPREGLWVPAYVTNRIGDQLVVYVPTSPNPTSGFTLITHQSKVVHSDMSIEEASSFVISLGVDMPKPEEAGRLTSPGSGA
jgi:uncharacterized membrane protein